MAVAKVAQIFRRFDNDRDRYLNYEEVKALEWEVSRQELSTANYVALCEAVVADPDRGLDEQVRLRRISKHLAPFIHVCPLD